MNYTEEQLINLYIIQNKSVNHISEEFNINKKELIRIIKKLNLKKTQSEISNSKKQYCTWKYGVDNPAKLNYIQDKIKETNIKKYCADNPSKSDKIKESISKSIKKFYENEDNKKSSNIKKQNTCLEKYGETHHLKSKHIIEKRNITNTERYGGNSPTCDKAVTSKRPRPTKDSIEKQKKTFLTNLLSGKYDHLKRKRTSAAENEIKDWLESLDIEVNQSNRSKLKGKEIDLFLPEHNLGIEYNGLFWHSDSELANSLPNDYHYNKYLLAKEAGITLLTIWESEWANNSEVVKAYILAKLGKVETKLWARKCVVKEIENTEANEFCRKYHWQGATKKIKRSFGLFSEKELMSVMTFGQHHRNNTSDLLVLSRFCIRPGIMIVGGAQKLFTHSVREMNASEIISWSDNRISNGGVYSKLGFIEDAKLKPDYFYLKSDRRTVVPKQSAQKNKIGCPEGMTEREYCRDVLKMCRIYDCGKIRWKWIRKQ